MNIDFEMDDLLISARVKETLDAYGTGDSPTLYEVDIKAVIDLDGYHVHLSDIGDGYIDEIEGEAIRQYKGD
jgi:hypothetical protein